MMRDGKAAIEQAFVAQVAARRERAAAVAASRERWEAGRAWANLAEAIGLGRLAVREARGESWGEREAAKAELEFLQSWRWRAWERVVRARLGEALAAGRAPLATTASEVDEVVGLGVLGDRAAGC